MIPASASLIVDHINGIESLKYPPMTNPPMVVGALITGGVLSTMILSLSAVTVHIVQLFTCIFTHLVAVVPAVTHDIFHVVDMLINPVI